MIIYHVAAVVHGVMAVYNLVWLGVERTDYLALSILFVILAKLEE